MSTVVIVVLILAAFGLALLLKRYEHTLVYVLLLGAFCAWFLVMSILKANTGPTRLALISGFVIQFMLSRIVTLAAQLKRP